MSQHSGNGHGYGMPPLARSGAPSLRTSSGGVEIYNPRGQASAQPTVSSSDLSDLVSRLQKLSTSDDDKVKRPGFGKRGSSIALRANLFQLDYPKDVVLCDYKIRIEPNIPKEAVDLRRHVVAEFARSQELSQFVQGIAHDGVGRLIAKLPLPKNFQVTVTVPAPSSEELGARSHDIPYFVTLVGPKPLKAADLAGYLRGENPDYDPEPIVSAFNLIVMAHAARTGFRALTKNAYYFDPNADTGVPTRPGIKVVNGFFASVRPVHKSLMINVNTCMSAFYVSRSMTDALREFMQQSRGAVPQRFFGNMKVVTSYLGYDRRNTVKAIGPSTARRTKIQSKEFGNITVEEYFLKRFRIALRNADDLPVVNVGKEGKDMFVPAELCKIVPGTLFSGELKSRESAALCAANNKTPAGHAQTITIKGLRLLGFEDGALPMASFGIKISTNMAVVAARVLPAPSVVYPSGRAQVVNGSWTTRGIQFAKPSELKRIAVVVLKDGNMEESDSSLEVQVREAVKALLGKCRQCGMNVDPDFIIQVIQLRRPSREDPYRDEDVDKVSNLLESLPGRPQMVLALMANRDKHIYAGLHRYFDVSQGFQSVFGLIENMLDKEGRDQYLANLALKINTKLGGVNHRLESVSLKWLANTMVVGLDVVKPDGNAIKGAPSIAAVAASCDMNFAQYHASVSLQGPKQETVENLRGMILERLKDYRERMDSFPERILIFRAGISDGQHARVMATEIKQLNEAFGELKKYKPKLTYIACSKGHQTRFYPTKAEDADRTSNSLAGTVVDQGVTSVYDYDFYLQAHAGTQGIARAAHYTVLHDDNKFSPDALQQGVNDMSHLWATSTKSVSLAPPAYWASRACARARLYLHKVMSPVEGSKEARMSSQDVIGRAKGLWRDGVHDALKNTMFYA
ncbi:hypothetical protein ACEPAI_4353 [Sanghuangporus weigelae]